MTEIDQSLQSFEDQLGGLEARIGTTQAVTVEFEAELQRMQVSLVQSGRQVSDLSRTIGGGLRRAFDGLVFDGARLSDVLTDVGRSMALQAYGQAVRPLQNQLGALIAGGLGNLASAATSAAGPAVSRGTAIAPAIAAAQAGAPSMTAPRPVSVAINVAAADAPSFQRSRTQIAAQLARAIGTATRNQ